MKKLLLLLLPALSVLLCGGCGKRFSDADAGVRDQVLLFGNGDEPKDIDPHTVTGVPENHIISALIEGLINYHLTDDNQPEPGVAERWTATENYSVWTFYLRKNAVWSNGDPVTAQDFVFSWERMLNPALAAEYAEQLYVLDKATEYNTGTIKDFSQVGVKAVDEHTLVVHLVGPTPYFLSMLQHYSWFPVHPGTIKKFGAETNRATGWTRVGNFVGNGPFQLKEWTVNQVIRVTRSPTYWDAANVRLNEIRFYAIQNAVAEETAFANGQLHITNEVKSDNIRVWRQQHSDKLRIEPYLGTYFYRLNLTRPPFDDVRVRKALNLAIDRQQLVDRVVLGGQRPALGFTPEGMLGYPTPKILSYDPARARALLAEAGFPDGKGFPVKEILFNSTENHKKIAEAIQRMWNQNLGIDVSLVNQEWKVYIDNQQRMSYDISRSGWIGDYMDPITFLSMWTTGNGNNNTGWSNTHFDELIHAAKVAITPELRYARLLEAENILLDELPFVNLYWYSRINLVDTRVKNWYPKLLDNRPWKYIFLEAESH
ncbi:MAG: peptide ABC transporter substrate-binding protein [Verrucomicrobiota bacterium]|nr:peptide ABC transporter substrate-binding protein [Verrucomicrobiota bacterium]